MAFAHTGMALPSQFPQDFRTNDAVTDIWFCTEALYTRGIASEDTYVVKHSGFFEKLFIKAQFGVGLGYLQALICHLTTMNHQNLLQFIILRVIAINYRLVIHIDIIWHGLRGFLDKPSGKAERTRINY